MTRLSHLVDATTKLLQDVEIVKGLGGYEALVVGKPTEGELAIQSNPMVIWGGAAMRGLIGGLGLALVVPASSGLRGLRGAQDIRDHLGWSVMGVIPWFRAARRVRAGQP